MKRILMSLALALVAGSTMTYSIGRAATASMITVNPQLTYQTFTAWEAADFFDGGNPAWPYFKDALYDKVINDYGINRIRLAVYPGVENTTDYFSQSLQGQIAQRDWIHCYGRAPLNDDADPNHLNPNGFQFSSLDWKIDNMLLSLRQLMQARGEHLLVNLTFVSFTRDATCNLPYYNGFLQYNSAPEYAEFMVAVFQHMQTKYGFVPDTIELELEPDNTGFDGTKMGNALKATQALLAAQGFNPKYIVPATTSMSNALPYFNAIKSVVGDAFVRQWIQELAYHRYAGVSDTALQGIANTSVTYGIGASMLEYWDGPTYQLLQQDLTMGQNTAWQQDALMGIYRVDVTNPTQPVITTPSVTAFNRQYTRYIRPGALRISASTDNAAFSPVAFINRGGIYVVVVNAAAGGGISIRGLPAGKYGVKYTTNAATDTSGPDLIIAAGGTLSTSLPAAGIVTVYSIGRASPFLSGYFPYHIAFPLMLK